MDFEIGQEFIKFQLQMLLAVLLCLRKDFLRKDCVGIIFMVVAQLRVVWVCTV
jgi:hypothetical protein